VFRIEYDGVEHETAELGSLGSHAKIVLDGEQGDRDDAGDAGQREGEDEHLIGGGQVAVVGRGARLRACSWAQ
jgi:hypothetical protein